MCEVQEVRMFVLHAWRRYVPGSVSVVTYLLCATSAGRYQTDG